MGSFGARAGPGSKLCARGGSKTRLQTGQGAGLADHVPARLALRCLALRCLAFVRVTGVVSFTNGRQNPPPAIRSRLALSRDLLCHGSLDPHLQHRQGRTARGLHFIPGLLGSRGRFRAGERHIRSTFHKTELSLVRNAGERSQRPLWRASEPGWWPGWWREEIDPEYFGGSKFLAGSRRR